MREPESVICTILNDKFVQCTPVSGGASVKYPLIDALGYLCVSPDDYASIKTHHSVLHKELNKCQGN